MSYQDHLKTCSFCSKRQQPKKPTVRVKSASSYQRDKKLASLAALITGVSYPGISYAGEKKVDATRTKGASSLLEKQLKLKELGKMIRGL